MVTTVWAVKEKTTIKGRDGRTVVQTSKVILGGHCGCDLRYVPGLLNFLSCVRLGDTTNHSQSNVCWQLEAAALHFQGFLL